MTRRKLSVSLDPDADVPLYVQIAQAISQDIQRGRLSGGSSLPGSRSLALSLGVNRNTVLAALAELEQEGWIETRPRSGSFVSSTFGNSKAQRKARSSLRTTASPQKPRTRLELPGDVPPDHLGTVPAGVLPLVGGLPDMRLIRRQDLTRAFRRAVLQSTESLAYGSAWGHPRLRRALVDFLGDTRGIATTPESICVTRGSQMAIYLAGRTLLTPGDRVAVEAYGYRPAWEALRMAGAELVPLPVDGSGLRVDALRAACEQKPIRALYLTPHHQYPTTVTLTAPRRVELLALAHDRQFAILEDDYDHEQHYAGRPVLPLASRDSDVVIYIGTLSKVLAPGLRAGYLVGPRDVVERAGRIRTYIDRQGDLPLEEAIAQLIEEGELARHTRRVGRHCHERRDALVEALRAELGSELTFRIPPGGMALWARARLTTDAWAKRALEQGVFVQPGRRYRFDGQASAHLRLGFGALTPAEIREAVRRLARAHRPATTIIACDDRRKHERKC